MLSSMLEHLQQHAAEKKTEHEFLKKISQVFLLVSALWLNTLLKITEGLYHSKTNLNQLPLVHSLRQSLQK